MGKINTEQAVAIIDSVTEAIGAANPDPIMHAEPNMNFWPLLFLAIIPVVLGWWLNKRRKKKNGKQC